MTARQRAAVASALFASGIGMAAPAQELAAPTISIITPSGDYRVNIRPLPALAKVPQQQPVVADPPTPPGAVAMPSPLPAPSPAAAMVPAPAPAPAPAAVALPTAPAPAPQTPQTPQTARLPQLSQPLQVPQPPQSPPLAVTQIRPAVTSPAGSGATAVAEPAQAAVDAAVRAWATAWANKDIRAYLASYGPTFLPQGKQARPAWEEMRRTRIVGKRRITISLSSLVVNVQGDTATAKFRQDYSAGALNISSRKALVLVKVAPERWVIVRESTGG